MSRTEPNKLGLPKGGRPTAAQEISNADKRLSLMITRLSPRAVEVIGELASGIYYQDDRGKVYTTKPDKQCAMWIAEYTAGKRNEQPTNTTPKAKPEDADQRLMELLRRASDRAAAAGESPDSSTARGGVHPTPPPTPPDGGIRHEHISEEFANIDVDFENENEFGD